MGSFAIVAIFVGLLIIGGLFWWIRQREEAESLVVEDMMRRFGADQSRTANAMLVTNEVGALQHMNTLTREWLGLQDIDPTLEDIMARVRPQDKLYNLLTSEGESTFEIADRWVRATSHFVPASEGNRVVVVMRELRVGTADAQADDTTGAVDMSVAMRVINEIGETVNAGMGIELALQILLEIINKAIPSDAGEICIWNAQDKFLQQRGWIGDTRYLLTVATQGGGYQPGQGIAGWMAEHDQPLVVGSADDQVNAHVLMKNNPYASAAGVPVWLNEEFVGTLTLFSDEENRYDPEVTSLLMAVNKAIGQAIRNAELYAKQEARIRDIASLQQIAEQPKGDNDSAPIYKLLNERMANLLDADMCGVLLYERSRQALVPQLPFHGLPDHVADKIVIPLPAGSQQEDIWTNQPYWVANDLRDEPLVKALNFEFVVEAAGIDNTALFPMKIAGERIGIMAISNKQTAGGFTPNDIQNLRVLSSQAAIVVENVRLYERERRIDTELVGLQEMTQAIGSLDQEGEFYAEISSRIARLMNSAMCGILTYDEIRNALVSELPFYGIEDDLVRDYAISLPQGSVMAQLWNEELSWYSNDVATAPLVYEAGLDHLTETTGVEKTMIAVMAAGGRRIGVVQISNKLDGGDYDEKDERLLQIFATQAGAIIENATLYREVQIRARQAERLRRVAELASSIISTDESYQPVLSQISELTDSKIVFINVIDENSNALVMYPRWVLGYTAKDTVVYDLSERGFDNVPARSGKHIISADINAEDNLPESYVANATSVGMNNVAIVPLVIGDRIIGELGVANHDGDFLDSDLQTVSTVAAQIAPSVERLLIFEEAGENLRQRVDELDAISRISNELTLTLELDKILDVIREEAVKATKASGCSIVLLRPESEWRDSLEPELGRRVGDITGVKDFIPIEEKTLNLVGSEPIIVDDYNESELGAVPTQARSAAAVAIIFGDAIVGVISVYDIYPNTFDDRASNFLMTLAAKASLAYHNNQLYEQQLERGERLRQRVDQLKRIFDLSQMVQTGIEPVMVLDAISFSVQQSVGFDNVLMCMWDDEEEALRRVAHAGIPLAAFNESKGITLSRESTDSLFQDEYRMSESYFYPIQEVESWYTEAMPAVSTYYDGNRSLAPQGKSYWHEGDVLLVPVYGHGGNLIGLMSLDRPHNNKRPDVTTIEVLEIFAHQASTMIENTRLFRESRLSAEREATLNDTMEAIAATLDLDQIAEELAHGLRSLVKFDRLSLMLVNRGDSTTFTENETIYNLIQANFDEEGNVIVAEDMRRDLENTAIGRAYETGEIHIYRDDDEAIAQYTDLNRYHNVGEHSTIYLPMASGGEILGVLSCGSMSRTAFGEEATSLLSRAAQLVASTVQNARLFNQAVNLQILNRSVVESIQQGIVVLDNEGIIFTINQNMRTAYGWEAEARGQHLFAYRPELKSYLEEDLVMVFQDGEPREKIGQATAPDADDFLVRNFYLYPLVAGAQIRGVVLLVEDVTERRRLEDAIESRANQLAALTEVSTHITASLERDEVIELAMDEMGWIIPFDTMTMWRRNGSYMVLEGIAGQTSPTALEDGIRILIQDFGAVSAVIESKRVIGVSGVDVPRINVGQSENTQSWMGVPLVNQGHVVGMITLERDEPHAYDSRQEHNVAFAFASQVAIALANADLFEQTFERTNELGTLLEAARTTSLTSDINELFNAVADLLFGALEMEDATIMTHNPIDNELEVQFSGNRNGDELTLPVGTIYNVNEYPAREEALKKRDVIVIIDTDDLEKLPPYERELQDMRAAGVGARMLVPLVVRDDPKGLIQLDQHANAEDSISQQKLRLARALGSQVAVAIENARLTQETSSRFEELLTINQLSQSISSTLRLDDMLPIIREQVPQVTRAEELYLALYDAENEMIHFPLAVREDGTEFDIPSRPLGNDEVSFIIKRKHALSLDDDYFSIEELRRSMKITAGEGEIKSYMGVPLKSGDTIHGVLAIRNVTKKNTFNINDDRILTTVGSQLGAAIQNARLFEQVEESREGLERLVQARTNELAEQSEELEEERDRLDKLYQITSELARTLDMEQLLERSLGMLSKAVGADDGVIMLSDPATDNLYSRAWINPHNIIYLEDEDIRTHPAEGLAEWLIHEDESTDNVVLIDDLEAHDYWHEDGRETGLRSALAVMLENNEDPMGVMVLLSNKVGNFTENHIKLIVPAAAQVAASINSADLYQLIRDQAERMGQVLRKEQEQAQTNSAIVESIADGVMLANTEGEIVLFNSAAERILDLSREQAIGQSVNKIGGIYGESALKWTQMVTEWDALEEQTGADMMSERIELGGKIIQTQLSPVYIGDSFLGTVSVFRDITRDVEADRAKSKFIENVSHEFRTPLTPMKGYIDLLLMMGSTNLTEQQLNMIGTIKQNTDRLAALVDDVLRVSKLDSGEDKLYMTLVDLQELVPETLSKFENLSTNQEKNITATLNIDGDVPNIRADRDKLGQVLSNLIDNAFNYTRENGSITIEIQRLIDKPEVQITIADTGVGIPDEFKEAAWRRFERHDPTAVDLDVAGTGLGLSLARDLILLHNGEIWFESEVNVGTTFFIRLPIEQPSFRTTTAEFPVVDETESIAGD